MDQSGLSLGSYVFYTRNSSAHQAFIVFFSTVTQLLGASSSVATNAEDVWQLEKAIAEVTSLTALIT